MNTTPLWIIAILCGLVSATMAFFAYVGAPHDEYHGRPTSYAGTIWFGTSCLVLLFLLSFFPPQP